MYILYEIRFLESNVAKEIQLQINFELMLNTWLHIFYNVLVRYYFMFSLRKVNYSRFNVRSKIVLNRSTITLIFETKDFLQFIKSSNKDL